MVRTRMAPSPTGEFHVGSLRTLLYNYAWAKKNQGQFILRIEDTDQARLVPGAQERILQVIRDYGLSWDEGPDIGGPYGPYVQSQRLDIYQQHAQYLIDQGDAYYCFCSKEILEQMRTEQKQKREIPRYDRRCLKYSVAEVQQKLKQNTPHVIRQKLPDNQHVAFNDSVMGEITINTKELDDTVLLKSDGFPTYHLAVVIDDHLMKITHIMRGSEWISSVPKHILLYQAFGWDLPIYAHLPVFLSPDGKGKMSKRHSTVSARSFLDQGYLPEAMLNYLMLLGWTPIDDRGFFTLEEFIQVFDINRFNNSNPAFDLNKLNYFNAHYIRVLSDPELAERLKQFAPENVDSKILLVLAPLVKERLKTLAEFKDLCSFMFSDIQVPDSGWKSSASEQLSTALQLIKQLPEANWNTENLTEKFMDEINVHQWSTSHFFMNLRLAVTGQPITPPITECIVILGKEKTLRRLNNALVSLRTLKTP